jgi:hypothetical protein
MTGGRPLPDAEVGPVRTSFSGVAAKRHGARLILGVRTRCRISAMLAIRAGRGMPGDRTAQGQGRPQGLDRAGREAPRQPGPRAPRLPQPHAADVSPRLIRRVQAWPILQAARPCR